MNHEKLKDSTVFILLYDFSTSTDRYAKVDVSVLLYHIEQFPEIVILTTNLINNIDEAFFRRLKFMLQFETPLPALRERLWKVRNMM